MPDGDPGLVGGLDVADAQRRNQRTSHPIVVGMILSEVGQGNEEVKGRPLRCHDPALHGLLDVCRHGRAMKPRSRKREQAQPMFWVRV